MSDVVTQSLEKILGGEYEVFRDIPIFDEHDEFDGKGKLVRRFDYAKLKQIADTCNQRAKAGDPAMIGPGHTIPTSINKEGVPVRAKETDQPPIWGVAMEMKVGRFGPNQKLGLLANHYIRKQVNIDGRDMTAKQALAEFPRRSIELFYADGVIDRVSLLRQAPARDLGLTLSYSKDRFFRNSQCRGPQLQAALAPDGKLRYAMEDQIMPDPTMIPDAAAVPDPDELTPEEKATADRYWKHYRKCYAADFAGAPSGSNTSVPDVVEEDKDKQQFSKSAEAERYQKENAALKNRLERLEHDGKMARYKAELEHLRDAEGIDLDLTDELSECQSLDANGFAKHKDRISKHYQRAPIGGQRIPLDSTRDSRKGGVRKYSRAEIDSAVQYCEQNPGTSYELALEKVTAR